jgi:hypothetical protein
MRKNVVQWGMPQMTIWRTRITCWIPKAASKHTLTICNTRHFPTATTVAQTPPNVTLYVYCLFCLLYIGSFKQCGHCCVLCCILTQVMQLAETLLDNLQLAMKGKCEDEQCVGPCFIELADQMKHVYGHYCMNHNGALMLLEKVSSVQLLAVETEQISSALTCLTCISSSSMALQLC